MGLSNVPMRHASNGGAQRNNLNFDVYQSQNFSKKQTLGNRANSQTLNSGGKPQGLLIVPNNKGSMQILNKGIKIQNN